LEDAQKAPSFVVVDNNSSRPVTRAMQGGEEEREAHFTVQTTTPQKRRVAEVTTEATQDSTGSIVIDLASFFNVGNTNLEYQVTIHNHALLDVSVNGSILTLTKKPETSGTAAVTVSAFAVAQHAQPFRADLSFNFTVIPPNNAPTRTSKALPDVTEPQVFNLAELFQDVDGDSLTYEIIVSNSSVVNTTVVDGDLYVTRGFEKSEQSVTESGTVTIIARDSSAQTNDTFTVTFAFVPQIAAETLAFHHGVFNAREELHSSGEYRLRGVCGAPHRIL
jgi:hypothetical protein